MTGEMTITKCGCGDRACYRYRLSGAGSEGMFEHAEATKIALRYNTQPELLAALQNVATWLIAPDLSAESIAEHRTMVGAALAKATGREG